jgi:type IV secretion system protein VirB10
VLVNERRGADPRATLSPDDLFIASLRAAPKVARPPRRGDGLGLAAGVIGALALGAFTLLTLSHQRAAAPQPVVATEAPPQAAVEPIAPPAAAADEDMTADADAEPEAAESNAAPMVVDNSVGMATNVAPHEAAESTAPSENRGEAFALRAGQQGAASARAEPLSDPSHTVMQGAIIPAVLETALNSDLPGFTRAIVSRDVRSFDGSAVLIPRGSRLIGQYRAASAPGQSRAFIVWSRLIRPDGVSIELASPALDAAGAVGVPGSVDTHFFQNFGRSFLLSIVGALPAAATGSGTVIIGGGGAQSAASQSDGRVPPTIRVPIGTPIQVFTARDLSFQ